MTTLSKEARRHWLTLKLVPYIGVSTLNKINQHYSLKQLLEMGEAELKQLKLRQQTIEAIRNPNTQLIDQMEHWAEQPGQHIICYQDEAYPERLKHISSPPELLFVKGDIAVLDTPQLAMVGSRDLTIGGRENAFNFAKSMAKLGITVTSGLAIGVDGQSHKGALQGEGKTIAVLGTGLDQIYPKRHKKLANDIIEHGALVSEFLPGQAAKAEHFPRRNRIISGLSLGTLVVEAALKSGSLITARYAMEQGREVFAIPGSIHNPMSEGCHQLIKQGAKLVETVHDIIEEIGEFQQYLVNQSIENNQHRPNTSSIEDPILASIGYEITSVDCIAERTNLPVHEVLARLLDMELQGKISAIAGGYTRV